jgi:hypothetical protein
MSTLELVKNERVGVLLTMFSMFSIHNMPSILTKFENKDLKKIVEKSKKQRNEQSWTLAYTLVLQTTSSP